MSETVGQILARERRRQGKTLGDVEKATRVRARRLEALENGEWDALPSPAYVKGYIIGYAKYLDLDPRPLVDQFKEETGMEPDSSEQVVSREQVVASREQVNVIPWRGILMIVGVIVVLVVAIWGIGRVITGPDEPLPVPNTPSESGEPQDSDVATPPGVTATQTIPSVTATETDTGAEDSAVGEPFTLRIEVESTSASWLRVTIDGLKAYEGTLSGGQVKEWDVTDSATIRVGKVTAVSIYRDDELVEIPEGETPEFTLTTTD